MHFYKGLANLSKQRHSSLEPKLSNIKYQVLPLEITLRRLGHLQTRWESIRPGSTG